MAFSACTAKPYSFARSPTRRTILLCLWMINACVTRHFCETCGCLPVTQRATTVRAQQRIRVLWSSAPPLLTACLDDSEPHLQA
ncbi:hypothetical protein T02_164, partial [Trichinella nativa]